MMSVLELVQCILGPRLHKIYKINEVQGRPYTPNPLESWSDNVIRVIRLTWHLSVYTSPLILTFLYRRGYFGSSLTPEVAIGLTRAVGTIGFLLLSSACLRGVGRYMNPEYRNFVPVYQKVKESAGNLTKTCKKELNRYDLDFSHWPVEFKAIQSKLGDYKKPAQPLRIKSANGSSGLLMSIFKIPIDILGYVAIHTFGKRMMYPGSVGLLQQALSPMLLEGRTRLVEKYGGERFKLETVDGNSVDAMFVDRREKDGIDGRKAKTLVICCEGNAGFYEIGTMATPLEAGYSVLGWNHPGFGGSTGTPFPAQEVNAVDAVVKFAVEKLNFSISDILVFAWSIGGYPATWISMQYPEIKGLILDASFDDVVALAVAKMPPSWKVLVEPTVKNYFNLNNSQQLNYYSGPLLFIRRVKDEIIHTDETQPLRTNRANDLLIKLLRNRFPNLMDHEDPMWALLDWLSGTADHQSRILSYYRVNEDLCLTMLKSYIDLHGAHYPVNIGEDLDSDAKIQLILYLATKHLKDYDSTHCTPLPVGLFSEPWDLFADTNNFNSKL